MTKILILLALMISNLAFSADNKVQAPICSLYYAKAVKQIAEAHGDHDKYKHCAVSCMLALRCPAVDVMEIGILKELADMIGPGNADMKDLEADYKGIDLVIKKKAKTDKSCIVQCQKIYPCP